MKFPKRHRSHSLEDKSRKFFEQHLPEDWNINAVYNDYGQDLNIEIAENGNYKGLDLIVQLKSSRKSSIVRGNIEAQTLKISNYNYLWGNLRVVMIVKFVESENEAYWALLKDVKKPSQNAKTFTVHIPRQNKLSELLETNWQEIVDYVRQVTEKKLAVNR